MIRAPDITPELKEEYLNLIREGMRPDEAARSLDSRNNQFSKHRRPQSQWYDEDFAEAYEKAITSDQHKEAFREGLLDAAVKSAKSGNAALMTKLLATYHPDFEWTRHANFKVDVNVKMLHEILPHIPREQLEEAVKARELALKREPLQIAPPAA